MKTLMLFLLALALLPLSGCNKAILYGRDKEMEPVAKAFSISTSDAFKMAKESLASLGYRIEKEDESQGTIRTSWLPTKASSHYVDLFDRRDYGTVGAYYRILVHVSENNGKTQVEVSAPTRSIIVGRLMTAHREENKVLKKMTELLRREDFEMTNVGVSE